jgi:hypothetical protein
MRTRLEAEAIPPGGTRMIPMTKTRFTAQLINDQAVSRTSTSLAYTHAVVSAKRAISWHTTRELGERGLIQAVRYHGFNPSDVRLVKVQAEVIQPKRTSPADKNAARRGVISRQITQYREYLARAEAGLADWENGNSEAKKARLIRDFGEKRGLDIHAGDDIDTRRAPIYARERIAKLEAERDALLAAKAEG